MIKEYKTSLKQREYNLQYYRKNREKCLERRRKYRESKAGKEKRKLYMKIYQQRLEVKKRRAENEKRYCQNQKYWERKLEGNKRWRKKYSQNNPFFRIKHNIGTTIQHALKEKKANRFWEELVGYTLGDLMKHLEKQFDDKMTWDNYGAYWWVDHAKPQSLFKYKTPEDSQFKECWALKNLQPMEKIANMKKGNKYSLGENLT